MADFLVKRLSQGVMSGSVSGRFGKAFGLALRRYEVMTLSRACDLLSALRSHERGDQKRKDQ